MRQKYNEGEKMNKFIGKKLDEVISIFPNDVVLHIGSNTCFMFIGSKEEYEKDIESVSKSLINDSKKLFKKNKKKYEKAKGYIDDPKYKNDIKRNKETMEWSKKQMNNYKMYIDSFVPLSKRKILDVYPRTQRDGIIIIIEGDEIGSFWTKEEYDRRKKDIKKSK